MSRALRAILLLCLAAVAPLALAEPVTEPAPTVVNATQTPTLTGRPVQIDLYWRERPRPLGTPGAVAESGAQDAEDLAAAAARGVVVLAHGFMRSRHAMAGHARSLAEAGFLAIASDLPYSVSARDNGEALGELVALIERGRFSPPLPVPHAGAVAARLDLTAAGESGKAKSAAAPRVVLLGYSAGALAALFAAERPGVVAYVGLDPIDFAGGEGLVVARRLAIPTVLIYGPPSACNVLRIADTWNTAFADLREARFIEHASHCDFEAPSDALCAHLCGATNPQRQDAIRAAVVDAVKRLLAD
ncbi:hypothetical protein GH865_02610 [Rhodocyclus tenuis]|uniref:hypothetical protein n=1 Tax=Rhodocyclus gracilis TaxID=2929842 RepID=UPI001298CE52|nr:hypothetical protein [Rhodocyclus gracilis]MRD72142.1 hypothetical protein [Rhodocyclus gracilis]